MEFHIVHYERVDFERVDLGSSTFFSPVDVELSTMANYTSDKVTIADAETYRVALENSLIANHSNSKEMTKNHNINPKLDVFITASTEGKSDGIIAIRSHKDEEDGHCESILAKFVNVYGDHVLINVAIENLRKAHCFDSFDLEAKALAIVGPAEGGSWGCEYKELNFAMPTTWKMRLDRPAVLNTNRLLLSEAAFSDLVLIARNGVEIKCHKAVLSVSSDYFKAMFRSGMVEATSNSVKMSDMSEDAVGAFLRFIYYWDVEEASKRFEIALQLLSAGHEYILPNLERAMQGIICSKPVDWFNVDDTLKLLILSRKLEKNDARDKVLEKAVHVLRKFSRASADNILKSESFRKLYAENFEVALEISVLFLQSSF